MTTNVNSAVMARTYAKPPIVEALVELRFAPGQSWTDEVRGALASRLEKEYSGQQQVKNQFEVLTNVEAGEMTTSSRVLPSHVLFPTADGRALVGIGENLLTVHALAPYPGWHALLARVTAALDIYRDEARPQGVVLLSVRYIDQIALPKDPNLALSDYFPCLPSRPRSMPSMFDGFHTVTQAHDPDANYVAVLTMASVPTPPSSGSNIVLYDLNLLRTFAQPNPPSESYTHIEFLHAKQKQIFEDSITDATRSLFR
jgi:uncharacterized protein (TIGR04255 family)